MARRDNQDGSDRIDIDYLWPKTLRLPDRSPKLVYLDLNHWITLSKVIAGHPDGEPFKETLDGLIDAVERGAAIFPISDCIYFEIIKIGQYRQRRDLREAIERISRYAVVTSRSMIYTHEIEALLDELVGPNPRPISHINYLDWGDDRAFGVDRRLVIKNKNGEDLTAEIRMKYPGGPEAYDRFVMDAQLELNRKAIDGPSSKEEPELRAAGWNPEALYKIFKQRAEQEIEQVGRFNDDPRWRRGRIRDVITTREILIEINEALSRGLLERGIEPESFDSLLPRVQDARRAFDAMPSFDVAVTLKASYHRNENHPWTENDIADIDAMGSTIPYCDIVVTDGAVASHVIRSKLAERLNTVVLSKLSDLLAYL